MQQTEQSRAKQSQPARKEEKTAHRQFDRTGAPLTLLLRKAMNKFGPKTI